MRTVFLHFLVIGKQPQLIFSEPEGAIASHVLENANKIILFSLYLSNDYDSLLRFRTLMLLSDQNPFK